MDGIAFVILLKKIGIIMTLLPIIYISVLIFTSFMLFVIIISYISFKTKQRSNYDKSQGTIPAYPNSIILKPAITFNQPIKPVHIGFSPKAQKISSVNTNVIRDNLTKGMTRPLNMKTSLQQRKEKVVNNESRQLISQQERFEEKKLKSNYSLKARLEIMNQTQISKRSKENVYDENIIIQKNMTGINEANLFNYYSDNSEFDFVALSANNISRAV